LLFGIVCPLNLRAQLPRGILFSDHFEAAPSASPYTIAQQQATNSLATDSDPGNAQVGTWATYGGEADGGPGLFGVQVTSNVDPPTYIGSYEGSNVLRIFRSPVGSGSAASANFTKTQIGGKVRLTWIQMMHPGANAFECMIHFSGSTQPGSEGFDTARVSVAIDPDGMVKTFEGSWQIINGLTVTLNKWQTHQVDIDLDGLTWQWTIDGVAASMRAIAGNAPGNTLRSIIFRGGGSGNDLFYVDTLQVYPITKPIEVSHVPAENARHEPTVPLTYTLVDGFTETQEQVTDISTIKLFIDGTQVAPDSLSKVGDTATVSYIPPGGWTPETTVSAQMIFADTNAPPNFKTNQFSFLVLPSLSTNAPRQQDSSPEGLLVFEAENFDRATASVDTPTLDVMHWDPVTDPAGFSGASAMQPLPEVFSDGVTPMKANLNTEAAVQNSPRMDYKVRFSRTGTHYIWVRGYGKDGASDSCHVGLDGQWLNNQVAGFPASTPPVYNWSRTTTADGNAVMVPSVGYHFITIWMRENGFVLDKILITSNPNYVPSAAGPAESSAGPASSYWPFEEASGKALDVDDDPNPGPYPGTLLGTASRTNAVVAAIVPRTGANNTTSMNFTGVDGDAVDMGATNLDTGSGDFTLQAWINARAATGAGSPLFIAGKRIAGLFGDKGYELLARQSGSGLTVEATLRGGGPSATAMSEVLNTGQWYHLAAVRGGGNVRLYVDGALAQSVADATAGSSLNSTQHFSVGGAIQGDGDFHLPFDGMIDEVRLTLAALSPGDFLNAPLPTRPLIVSRFPAPGSTGAPADTNILITLRDGTVHVLTNTIQLLFNNVAVSPLITQSNATTFVSYDPPGNLAPGTVNTVQLIFTDDGTPPQVVTNTFSFTVAYVPISGPSYWRFEEASGDALDSLGPYPAVLRSNAVRSAEVPLAMIPQTGAANAMSIDGTGAAGSVGTAVDMGPAIQVMSNDFTLECWVKVTGTPNGGGIIVGKFQTGLFADKYFSLNHSPPTGGQVTFQFGGTGGNKIESALKNLNQWYHLAGVRQGDAIRLYVDGVLENSATLNSFRDFTSDQRFCVAGGASGGVGNMQGLVDEVRLSNMALIPELFLNSVPPPLLSASRNGNQLTLSWTVNGYVLQENTNVADPQGWTDVPGGGTSPVVVTMSAERKYYRLKKLP
jgi:hypothetical protein